MKEPKVPKSKEGKKAQFNPGGKPGLTKGEKKNTPLGKKKK